MKKEWYVLNLRMFDGEGSGAPAAAPEEAAATQGDENKPSGNTRRNQSGDTSDLLAPKGEGQTLQDAAGEQSEVKVTSNTQEDREKAFRDAVNGEFKDIYTREVQRIIDRRFAETKNLQKQLEESQPVLSKLAARYNILDGDMSKLEKAIDDDHSYWAAAAEEAGMSEDAFREMQRMRQQNAELLRQQADYTARNQAQAQVQQWWEEGAAVKAKYPQFDLNAELQNPYFVRLLRAHTPMEHAYKMIHFDELMSNAVQNAATTTQQAVVDNIRAKGSRPTENGTASQSAFTLKKTASQLTKEERRALAQRSRSGVKIEF